MVVGKYVYRWVGRNHVGGRHKNIEDESKQPLFYHNNICMDMYGYDGSDFQRSYIGNIVIELIINYYYYQHNNRASPLFRKVAKTR